MTGRNYPSASKPKPTTEEKKTGRNFNILQSPLYPTETKHSKDQKSQIKERNHYNQENIDNEMMKEERKKIISIRHTLRGSEKVDNKVKHNL